MAQYYIFYHIFLLGNWRSIVEDQLNTIFGSGLMSHSKLKIGIVHNTETVADVENIEKLLTNYNNYEIMFIKHTSSCSECDTLNELQNFSLQNIENVKILYIHSKGVTQYLSEREKHVWNWRKMMEYFLIEKWEDCVEKLNSGFDCCGINYQLHNANIKGIITQIKIFNGNFFWVNSEYVKKLDNTIIWEHKYASENWILSSEHNSYSPYDVPPSFDLYYNSIDNYKN